MSARAAATPEANGGRGPAALRSLGMAALFGVCAALYAAPAAQLLAGGATDRMLGDGTDPAALPYIYDLVLRTGREHPSWLLYGSVFTDRLDAPEGFGLWVPWLERAFVVLGGPSLGVERLATAYALFLFALDGALAYLFGRLMGWSRRVSFAAAVCWAFNPYTRARAAVHVGLAGTYFLPAVFSALLLLRRDARPRSVLAAAGLLLLAATAAHYYLISLALAAPLFVAFLLTAPDLRARWARLVPAALAAALPAVLLLGWSLARPVPPDIAARAHKSFVPAPGEAGRFLEWFGAHPVDFVTSDVKGAVEDWNPVRERLNERVAEEQRPRGNAHERANGIRWSVLALALGALAHSLPRRRTQQQALALVFAALALTGFAFALSPSYLGFSAALNALVPNFRVPSRLGPYAHFGALALAGLALTELEAWARRRLRPAAAGLGSALALTLVVLDYWPAAPLPVQAIHPPYRALAAGRADCGVGMTVPYVSGGGSYAVMVAYYEVLQQLRGTGCAALNRSEATPEDARLAALFGEEAFTTRDAAEAALARAVRFTRCVGLSWLVFDPALPAGVVASTCAAVGFEVVGGNQCRSPEPRPGVPTAERLSRCLAE